MQEPVNLQHDIEFVSIAIEESAKMIQVIADLGRKYDRQWFDDNWRGVLLAEGVTPEYIRFIEPWIKTWADEAFLKLEKENN